MLRSIYCLAPGNATKNTSNKTNNQKKKAREREKQGGRLSRDCGGGRLSMNIQLPGHQVKIMRLFLVLFCSVTFFSTRETIVGAFDNSTMMCEGHRANKSSNDVHL